MAIRTIRKDNDPVLRKMSRPVEKIDGKLHDLISDMLDTMYEAEGVGLAAPQVGILKRVIVIDTYEGHKPYILINPVIIEENGVQNEIEGCLSVPGIHGKVKRPAFVKVEGLDENGKRVEYEGTDLLARAFCHEIDHLNGILFTDNCEIVGLPPQDEAGGHLRDDM